MAWLRDKIVERLSKSPGVTHWRHELASDLGVRPEQISGVISGMIRDRIAAMQYIDIIEPARAWSWRGTKGPFPEPRRGGMPGVMAPSRARDPWRGKRTYERPPLMMPQWAAELHQAPTPTVNASAPVPPPPEAPQVTSKIAGALNDIFAAKPIDTALARVTSTPLYEQVGVTSSGTILVQSESGVLYKLVEIN